MAPEGARLRYDVGFVVFLNRVLDLTLFIVSFNIIWVNRFLGFQKLEFCLKQAKKSAILSS